MLPLNYINKREGRYGSFFKKIKIDYKVKNGIERMLSVTKDLSPKLAEDMKTDLLLFLLKQVAADGLVAKEEVQYINGYLDMNASVDWMVDYLNEYIRDLRDYRLPDTIKRLVFIYKDFEKEEPSESRDKLMNITVCEIEYFLTALVILCKGIVSIDGDISDEEIAGLNQIIDASSDNIEGGLGFIPEGVETARKYCYQDYEG